MTARREVRDVTAFVWPGVRQPGLVWKREVQMQDPVRVWPIVSTWYGVWGLGFGFGGVGVFASTCGIPFSLGQMRARI